MISTANEELLEHIRREIRRYRLVFIQIGAVHSPIREALSHLGDARSTPKEFLNRAQVDGNIVVIDDLETMEHDPHGQLSQLRGKVAS